MNADDIARAICAASKETGADPIDLALGNEPPVISPGQRLRGLAPKPPIGTLEREGFRPAPDTVKKVLRDDADEKRLSAPYVPVGRPVRKGDDFLRRAVENTQKLTPPPED